MGSVAADYVVVISRLAYLVLMGSSWEPPRSNAGNVSVRAGAREGGRPREYRAKERDRGTRGFSLSFFLTAEDSARDLCSSCPNSDPGKTDFGFCGRIAQPRVPRRGSAKPQSSRGRSLPRISRQELKGAGRMDGKMAVGDHREYLRDARITVRT